MNTLRLSLVVVAALALPACTFDDPVDPRYPVVEEDGPMVVNGPPPAAPVEAVGAPIAGRVWAPGYYWWGPRGYVWAPGRYVVGRPGYRWIGPRYAFRGGLHYYYGGRWVRR
ncbi:MAG TPA: hypothetical protein VGM56_33510 [Byssovorax sp.]